MSAGQAGPYDAIARKWLALAERRRAHLLELRATGRWRRYLTEAELDDQLREINAVRERFAQIAGAEPQDASARTGHIANPVPPNAPRRESIFEAAVARALEAAAELQHEAAKSAA